VTGFVVYSLGLAPVFTLATDMIIGSAPPERAGAASAISETGSEFGGALGIAVLGSLGTAIYRGEMASAPAMGIPADAIEAARSTLGGALAVAQQLPGHVGSELTALASNAFTVALEFTALTSAVIVLVTAILTAVLARRAQTAPEHDPGPASAGVPGVRRSQRSDPAAARDYRSAAGDMIESL
jgi:DHA2 family multidrug resistance protein-like MFS transporter